MSGNKNNKRNKMSSLIIIGILLVPSIFIIIPSTPTILAKSFWKEDTDLDFVNGTKNNVEIVGTGSSANLQLLSNLPSGYWSNKNLGIRPSPRVHHAMSSIYGTDKVLLFGGYQKGNISKTFLDIVLVLDTSGSMAGQKLDDLKTAVKNFINDPNLDPNDRIAIYSFDGFEAPKRQREFTICDSAGKTSLRNVVDSLSASGYTPLWDAIGEAVNYSIDSSISKFPVVIAVSDGEDYGNEGIEDGSEIFCPWHKWSDGEKQYQNQGPSNGDDIFTHDGAGNPSNESNWYWVNLNDESRYGVLNIINVTVFTVGLGLQHDDHSSNSSWRFPNGWMGAFAQYESVENSWSTNRNSSIYQESGTAEFNLWRVADTSGGKYFYAEDSSKLDNIFQNIATVISGDQTFFDGFETGNYNGGPWSVGGGWSVETTYQHSGTYYSLARGAYTNSSMTLTKDLDFTDYEDVKLIFYHYTDNVEILDYFYIDVSINSGSSWTQIKSWNGNEIQYGNYQKCEINLKSYDGQSYFRFRFRFTMNSQWEYWSIDDIKITGKISSGIINITTNYVGNETWVYDLSSNSWTQKNPISAPPARRFHSMAQIYGTDKVLMFGGQGSDSNVLDDTWVYDLNNNSWIKKSPIVFPSARKYHALASIYSTDKVLLFGGRNISFYNETWVYDLSDNKWSRLTPSISPISGTNVDMASIYNDDKIVFFDGETTETWVFDFSDKKWVNKNASGKISSGIGDIALASIHRIDRVLLYAGGYNNIMNGKTWVYDLSDNNWTYLSQIYFPGDRFGYAIATINGTNKVILFGGADDETGLFQLNGSYNSGNFISVPYDTGTNSSFKQITWNATTPTKTNISIQLRTAKTKSGLNSKTFVGPNGGAKTFYSISPSIIWSGHHGDRWIQCKIYLNTDDDFKTPLFDNFTIKFNNLPVTILSTPVNGNKTSNNSPNFHWNFTDLDLGKQTGFQVQIDDNITFNSVNYDSGNQSSQNHSWQFTTGKNNSKLLDGTWYWKVRTKDDDGDWGTFTSPWKLIIDTEPPKSYIYGLKNNDFYNEIINLTGLAIGNLNGSIVKQVEISIEKLNDNTFWNGSAWDSEEIWLTTLGTNFWSYDATTVQWVTDTYYTLRSRALDEIGNLELVKHGLTFMYDNKPPFTSIEINDNIKYTNTPEVELSLLSNDTGSGISKVAYSNDGKEWSTWEEFNETKYFNLSNGDGEKFVHFKVIDNANNSAISQDSIELDTIPPDSLSIIINNGELTTNSTNVTLRLVANDDLSGPAQMAFSTDGKNWTSWEPFSSEKLFILPPNDGVKLVYFKVKDDAGNVGEPVNSWVILYTPPSQNVTRAQLEPEFSSIIIAIIIFIIIITVIILAFIFRNKRKYEIEDVKEEPNKVLNKIKLEIYNDRFSDSTVPLENDVINKLNIIYSNGEISEDTYEFIKNFIDEKFK